MNTWRQHLPSPRTIILLLVTALLCLTIFQSHVHVHVHSSGTHDSEAGHAQHHENLSVAGFVDDLHELAQHGDTNVIDAKPTGLIIKQFSKDNFIFLIVFLFSLFVLYRQNIFTSLSYSAFSERARSRYRRFIPQLRAPPTYS